MASTAKLHPIYAALDAQQFTRAIKLASSLPSSNVLGKALLAHAYSRTGQRYESLTTIQLVLRGGRDGGANGKMNDGQYFQELQNAIDYSYAAQDERCDSQNQLNAQAQNQNQAQSSAKKGKKGKKKATVNATVPSKGSNLSSESLTWDWVDLIDNPPSFSQNWESLPPSSEAIVDEVSFILT